MGSGKTCRKSACDQTQEVAVKGWGCLERGFLRRRPSAGMGFDGGAIFFDGREDERGGREKSVPA